MNFLSPATMAIAAALTIPPLIALYFLKLKRTVKMVPSTLLWKRAVEDLQVNSPFQRLRSSLLLLLQLLILIAGVVALGNPMFRTAERSENTVIILVDKSASMAVVEDDGRTRLEKAKEQASICVENLAPDARAMVIAFCDRAMVVSSFDSDKHALKQKIDSIEQTQSSSSLVEAVNLAEAYAQNIMIGTDEAGRDKAPESAAPPATVFLFTDGRIADADKVAVQRLRVERINMTTVGERSDNAGIMAMAARRNYERPEILEVTATVRNFSDEPVAFDAVLYVDGHSVDIQPVALASGAGGEDTSQSDITAPLPGSVQVVAFDQVEFGGGGVVEVALRVDDALSADDRAWTIIDPPRHLRVLLVTDGGLFLDNVLSTLPLDLVRMSGDDYEQADDETLLEGERCAFDVVVFNRHSTARLPQGNYFFWGSVPKISGVSSGDIIDDQVIFDWADTHPILRHVTVETLEVFEWLDLKLPPEAVSLIDGQTSPVLSYLTRNASQFLISAFSPIIQDEAGNKRMNTYWVTSPDFVVFMQNAIQYLASSVAVTGTRSVAPGEPVTLPLGGREKMARIARPDGTIDEIHCAGLHTIHYARTRQVGTYHLENGLPGHDVFAVNLFDPVESRVEPSTRLTISAESVEAQAGEIEVNQPAWPYFLLAILLLLVVEWIVYNRRVLI